MESSRLFKHTHNVVSFGSLEATYIYSARSYQKYENLPLAQKARPPSTKTQGDRSQLARGLLNNKQEYRVSLGYSFWTYQTPAPPPATHPSGPQQRYKASKVNVQKIYFKFPVQMSILGYIELKKVFSENVCMSVVHGPSSKPLNLFFTKFTIKMYIGSTLGARYYFKTLKINPYYGKKLTNTFLIFLEKNRLRGFDHMYAENRPWDPIRLDVQSIPYKCSLYMFYIKNTVFGKLLALLPKLLTIF